MNITAIDLTLSPQELAAVIEALYDTTLKRLRWTLDPTRAHWRHLDWLIVQDVINDLVQAYTKAMMVFREKVGDEAYEGEEGKFVEVFAFTDEVWDMLTVVAFRTPRTPDPRGPPPD